MVKKLPVGKKLSFEEYELFYKSTEKVTDWRHAANRWNYSICLALLIAIVALGRWGLSDPKLLAVSILAMIILASMAILFCSLWIEQIEDFKALNNEKFSVLNEMAEHVVFSADMNDPRMSYSPFEREWKQFNRKKEHKGTQIIALESTKLEYWVPKAFRIIYACIIVFVTVIFIINWEEIRNTTLQLPSKPPASVISETKN